MSVAYKSPYKFVEDWFAKQFPYYGEFFVEENGEAKWNVVAAFEKAKEQAEAKKNKTAAKAVETSIEQKEETAAKPTEISAELEEGERSIIICCLNLTKVNIFKI